MSHTTTTLITPAADTALDSLLHVISAYAVTHNTPLPKVLDNITYGFVNDIALDGFLVRMTLSEWKRLIVWSDTQEVDSEFAIRAYFTPAVVTLNGDYAGEYLIIFASPIQGVNDVEVWLCDRFGIGQPPLPF